MKDISKFGKVLQYTVVISLSELWVIILSLILFHNEHINLNNRHKNTLFVHMIYSWNNARLFLFLQVVKLLLPLHSLHCFGLRSVLPLSTTLSVRPPKLLYSSSLYFPYCAIFWNSGYNTTFLCENKTNPKQEKL